MIQRHNDSGIHVAAVCGSEVRIYGDENANGVRPFLRAIPCIHYGAAKQYAEEFEAGQRAGRK